MKAIDILDVSLRDGGHRTNFYFDDFQLENILTSLDKSGIEYIEIGYRNGTVSPITNIGRAGLCQKEYLQFCRTLIKQAKIAVMVCPKNVSNADLVELKESGVSLIRLCVLKNSFAQAISIIEMAKNLSLEVSINLTNMSHYVSQELDKIVQEAVQYEPEMIYFADSNGSVFPDKVESIYLKYTQQYPIPFGFHAHDNLGLAQANALAAMRGGAQYIDASLAGMGKGIGNLKTEFFAAFLQALKMKTYNLETLLLAANYVRETLGIGHEPIQLDEFNRGISDPAY